MTSNSNGWVTASGAPEASTSNLATEEQRSRPPAAVVGNRSVEVVGSKLTVTHGTTYQAGRDADAPAPTSIMDTVKAHHGGVFMGGTPTGRDRVTLPGGMETTIDAAVNAGFLVRNQDGTFSDAPKAAALKDPAAAAKAQAAVGEKAPNKAPEVVAFGEAADATLQSLLATQAPGSLYKTLDSVLHTGDVDASTIERMASTGGIEPAEMAEKVNTVWQGAYDAGVNILADAGIEDYEAFAAFIGSDPKRMEDFREAARNMFLHGKAEGLQTMAEAYLPAMDRFEGARAKEMLTEAGWKFTDKPGGGINVIVNGIPVSWDIAVKQRIITFSRGA